MFLNDFGRFGFDPFADLWRAHGAMSRALTGLDGGTNQTYPPVNVWVGEHSAVVTALLPGLDPEDVGVTVHQSTISIEGKRTRENGENAVWHRRERVMGPFSRTIELPFRVDPDKVQARFENGTLEVEMERPESDRPRKIEIRTS